LIPSATEPNTVVKYDDKDKAYGLRRGEYTEQDWNDQLQDAIRKNSGPPGDSSPRRVTFMNTPIYTLGVDDNGNKRIHAQIKIDYIPTVLPTSVQTQVSNAVDATTQSSIVCKWRRKGQPVFVTCKCSWTSEKSREVTRELIDIAGDPVPLNCTCLDQGYTVERATMLSLVSLQHNTANWVARHTLRVVVSWARRRLVRNLKDLTDGSSVMRSVFPIYPDVERNSEDNLNKDEFEELMRNGLRKQLVQFRPPLPSNTEKGPQLYIVSRLQQSTGL
jgi:hypothetical protein